MSKTTSTTEQKPLTDLTVSETIESLTGHEEHAIKARFGANVGSLANEAWSTLQRALIFTLYARQDNGPKNPYKAAMDLTVGQLAGCFGAADDDEDGLPGSEQSPAGNDGEQP
jgi:hypothetical protein